MTKTIYYSCFIDGKDTELELSNEEHRFILGYLNHQQPGDLFMDEIYPIHKVTSFCWTDNPSCNIVKIHSEHYKKISKFESFSGNVVKQFLQLSEYIISHGAIHQVEVDF